MGDLSFLSQIQEADGGIYFMYRDQEDETTIGAVSSSNGDESP